MEINANKAVIQLCRGTVTISFIQAPPRKIAAVSIPVLMVGFQFLRIDANARREFMAYFDLYTKRGGG